MIRKNRGFILSEILLASAVISIALASCVIVIGSLQIMIVDMQNGQSAALIARRVLATAHLADSNNLLGFQKIEEVSGVFFTTTFSVSYRNSFTVDIKADVSWQDALSIKHRYFTDQIVDWNNASNENNCDWLDKAKGQLLATTSQALNIDGNNQVTDIAVRGDFAFVSADSAIASSSDLYILDIHDLQNPNIIGRINTGPGISAITTISHYIFAANAGSYQLQIIDVADPANPKLISQAKLPGVTVSGGAGYGNSITYFNQKLFIGLIKANGPEFHIVDVDDPSSPLELGSYEIGSTVNDIAVWGNHAVVVTPGQSSVLEFDISNPVHIQKIDQVTLTGWQTQSARSVALLGQNIYVGRTLGGFYSPNPEFLVSNLDSLPQAFSSLPIGATVDSMLVFGDYTYLATSDTAKAFRIIQNNFSSGNANSSIVTMTSALPSRAVALSCNEKALYVVTQNSQDFFHVFSLP